MQYSGIHKLLSAGSFFKGNEYFSDRVLSDLTTDNLLKSLYLSRDNLPSVAAVYRVKNAAAFLELSVCSILPLCKEIIIVDNNSTDNTREVIESLCLRLKEFADIKYYRYEQKIALAGEGYIDKITLCPDESISKYYEYCFSLPVSEYLLKVDAHCVYTPIAIKKIQSHLVFGSDVIYYRGIEILGKRLSVEPYIFRRSSGYKYSDVKNYELLSFCSKELKKSFIFQPGFLHLKRLVYSKYAFVNAPSIQQIYK
ncbi:MAG: glycosyltransferase [Proteobacteria bacterium]|nr:glycosyltransferase [Pseudomonadota bacterium]